MINRSQLRISVGHNQAWMHKHPDKMRASLLKVPISSLLRLLRIFFFFFLNWSVFQDRHFSRRQRTTERQPIILAWESFCLSFGFLKEFPFSFLKSSDVKYLWISMHSLFPMTANYGYKESSISFSYFYLTGISKWGIVFRKQQSVS